MIEAACFSMSVICDTHKVNFPERYNTVRTYFTGETRADCMREAKREGWKLKPYPGMCMCPACVRYVAKLPKKNAKPRVPMCTVWPNCKCIGRGTKEDCK